MLSRCTNPNVERYPLYGGRGVRVCEEWTGPSGFESFLAHIGPRPDEDHSLDRIDPHGNYEPGNVRWATQAVQHSNRRASIHVDMGDGPELLARVCDRLGIKYHTVYAAIRRGLPHRAAVEHVLELSRPSR